MKKNKIVWVGALINLIPFILGAIYYNRLPEQVATHFNYKFEPDGYSSKAMALFGIPLILTLATFLMIFLTERDPKKANHHRKIVNIVYLILPVVNLLVSVNVIAFSLGMKYPGERIILFLMGILFLIIGNYFPKIKRNYTIGIKLPWTLHSDFVWEKTHRMAGFLWSVGGGLIAVFTIFVPKEYLLPALFVVLIPMCIIPAIYSLVIYRKNSES